MAAINNLLPGSKRPIPYLLETGMYASITQGDVSHALSVVFFWKMIELNKVNMTYRLKADH